MDLSRRYCGRIRVPRSTALPPMRGGRIPARQLMESNLYLTRSRSGPRGCAKEGMKKPGVGGGAGIEVRYTTDPWAETAANESVRQSRGSYSYNYSGHGDCQRP
jgi:hypothetical protein